MVSFLALHSGSQLTVPNEDLEKQPKLTNILEGAVLLEGLHKSIADGTNGM